MATQQDISILISAMSDSIVANTELMKELSFTSPSELCLEPLLFCVLCENVISARRVTKITHVSFQHETELYKCSRISVMLRSVKLHAHFLNANKGSQEGTLDTTKYV